MQSLQEISSRDRFLLLLGHPRFFNQLSCGLDLMSMAGEWLTATANTNMFTYEIAPVFILMENVVLQKMREFIGWNSGDSILAPGGSISNLYAFLAARHKMFPSYKERGLSVIGGQLVMFTSDQVWWNFYRYGCSSWKFSFMKIRSHFVCLDFSNLSFSEFNFWWFNFQKQNFQKSNMHSWILISNEFDLYQT